MLVMNTNPMNWVKVFMSTTVRLVLRLSGCLYLLSCAVSVAGLTHYSAVCRHRLKAAGGKEGMIDLPVRRVGRNAMRRCCESDLGNL